MKKFLSIILSAVIPMTSVGVSAAYSDVYEHTEAIETVSGLGIMSGNTDGEFLPDNNLTRAEFASIIAGIYSYGTEDNSVDEWKKSYFKDVEEEIAFIDSTQLTETVEVFDDVLQDDENYRDIMLAAQCGLMVGVSDREFDPEGSMTVSQAVKTAVSMLGYAYEAKLSGGFPNGYNAVASRLGILKNISTDGYITRGETAQLLYNCLDIDLMQLELKGNVGSGFKTVEGETVLTRLLNLNKIRGRVTDDGYTAFTQESVCGETRITVDGTELMVDEDKEYARDFLGREIYAYYDKEEFKLVYAVPTNRDKAVTIDAENFVSWDKTFIEYEDEKVTRKVRLNEGASLIINNTAVSMFDESVFNFNYGTITLITPRNGDSADLIIIKKYDNFNIDYVDTVNETIFSKYSTLGNSVELNSDDKRVRIYNASGEPGDIKLLTGGTVTTICMGENLVEIFVSQKTSENIQIKETHYDGSQMYISDGTNSYKVSKDILSANPNAELPKIGNSYTLFFDIFMNVVMYTKTATDDAAAFLTKVTKIDESEADSPYLMITYFDMSSAKLEKITLPEKFTLLYEDDNMKTSKKRVSDLKGMNSAFEIMEAYITYRGERVGGMMRYSTDTNGDISQIELASNQKVDNNEENKLVKIVLDEGAYNGTRYCAGNIGGKIIVNKNTKVLSCNYKSDSFNTDKGFQIGTNSLFSDNEDLKNVMAYTTKKDSPVAEYIIYTSDVSSGITTQLPHTVGLVRKIYQSIDDDDMPVQILIMNEDNAEFTVTENALDYVKNAQGDTGYTDASGNLRKYNVEPGDIIRYGLSQDGTINQIQLLFDANADYSDGFTINGKTYYNYKNTKGALAGCIDHWDNEIYSYSTPFSVSYNDSKGQNEFSSHGDAWMLYSNEAMRVLLGYALKGNGDYVTVTSQNLRQSSYDEKKSGYVTNTYSGNSAILLDMEGKDVRVSKISLSQIKTYDVAGSKCDRILITARLGSAQNIIVIRGISD